MRAVEDRHTEGKLYNLLEEDLYGILRQMKWSNQSGFGAILSCGGKVGGWLELKISCSCDLHFIHFSHTSSPPDSNTHQSVLLIDEFAILQSAYKSDLSVLVFFSDSFHLASHKILFFLMVKYILVCVWSCSK